LTSIASLNGLGCTLVDNSAGFTVVSTNYAGQILMNCVVAPPPPPPPPPPREELPQTLDTVQAAVDLLTGSRDAAPPASCGGNPSFNCSGGNPVNPLSQIEFWRNAVSVSKDPDPATTYSFSATLSAATLTDIPFSYNGVDCALSLNTAPGPSSTIQVTGTLAFSSFLPGEPINELSLTGTGLQISGLTDEDITIREPNGGFGVCTSLNLGIAPFYSVLDGALHDRMGNNVCGVQGPALFGGCYP